MFNIQDYKSLLMDLVELQQNLIIVFENMTQVVPPSEDILNVFEELKDIIKPQYSISQVLIAWPKETVPFLPLFRWTNQRVGVIQYKDKNWLYILHGTLEIRFIGLPSNLDAETLNILSKGNLDILNNLSYGPIVETSYYQINRIDGFTPHSVSEYAESIRFGEAVSSKKDHEHWLNQLVDKGFLIRSNTYYYLNN